MMRQEIRCRSVWHPWVWMAVLIWGSAFISTPSRGSAQADMSPQGSQFLEVWYDEVLRGQIEAAAKRYEQLFRSPVSVSGGQSDRQRAAYRAGRCYEMLGNLDLAKFFYGRVSNPIENNGLLRQRAVVHLRRLRQEQRHAETSAEVRPEASLAATASSAPTAPTNPADTASTGVMIGLDLVLATFGEEASRWDQLRGALQNSVADHEQDLEAITELVHRFEQKGLPLSFQELAPEDSELKQGMIESEFAAKVAGPIDWNVMQTAVSERLLVKAMRACGVQNLRLARRYCGLSLILSPAYPASAEFWERLEESTSLPTLAALANRRLEDSQKLMVAQLRRHLQADLDGAIHWARLKRQDRVLSQLIAARRRLEIATPEVSVDREIRSIVERISYLYRCVAGGEDVDDLPLQQAWRQVVEAVHESLELAQSWVELVHEKWLLTKMPVINRAAPTGLITRTELNRLTVELRRRQAAARGKDDVERQKVLFQIECLKNWFPSLGEIDP